MAKKARAVRAERPVALQPTPEAMARDEHVEVDIVNDLGDGPRMVKAFRRRHVSLVDRWRASGVLDEAQQAACDHYARLHRRAGFDQRVRVQNLTGARGPVALPDAEGQSDARRELAAVAAIIGRDLALWELVVLHDRASPVDPATMSQRALDIAMILARHVTAAVSADLVARWRMRAG